MQQKAQILTNTPSLIGRYAKIVKHRRRIGRFGTVKDLFWKGDEPWLVLQLPTGIRVAVAVSWTDLPRERCLTKKKTPELLPVGLVELAKFVRPMTSQRRARNSVRKRKKT
jgi:hypothetical protein